MPLQRQEKEKTDMLFDEIAPIFSDKPPVNHVIGVQDPVTGYWRDCTADLFVGRKTCIKPIYNGNPAANGLVEWCIFGPPVYMGVDEEGNDCVARP